MLRPWLSATSSFPRLSERGEAATAGDPCWPRPHIRREPALAEDVAPWRGPTVEWYTSREKQMGLRRPCVLGEVEVHAADKIPRGVAANYSITLITSNFRSPDIPLKSGQ